ncbi:MAG: hypothetical protein ACI8XB_002207 [Patiriisocius sp.]|jgi:hypothetical protein
MKHLFRNYNFLRTNNSFYVLAIIFLSLIIFQGCASEMDTKKSMQTASDNSYVFNEEVSLIRSQIVESSILNKLIRDQDVPFNNMLLNSPLNSKNYINSLEMATNIGVYIADLNYLFAYEQDQARDTYLDAIFYLAEKLDVENAFDRRKFDVLLSDGLLSQSEKIDFLELLVKEAEEKIDSDARAQIVALILSGSYIEGIFINFNLANSAWPNEIIGNELLNHLKSYDRIKKILAHFKDYQPCSDRLADLEKLDPMVKMILKGDILEIKDNLEEINDAVGALRMSLIKV